MRCMKSGRYFVPTNVVKFLSWTQDKVHHVYQVFLYWNGNYYKLNSLQTSVLQTTDSINVKCLLVARKHGDFNFPKLTVPNLSKILNQKFQSEKDNCGTELISMPYYQPFNILTASLRMTHCITVSNRCNASERRLPLECVYWTSELK